LKISKVIPIFLKHDIIKTEKILIGIFFLIVISGQGSSHQNAGQTNTKKMKILIHITQGTENPTVSALAFLVAKTAIDEGHTVSLFLAGDAVQLIRNEALDNVTGYRMFVY